MSNQENAKNILCKIACIFSMMFVQILTVEEITKSIPDNHWWVIYNIFVSFSSVAVLFPLRENKTIRDVIDIALYELVFLFTFLYSYFGNKSIYYTFVNKLSPDLPSLFQVIPSLTFLMVFFRVISPLNWPPLGLLGWLGREHLSNTVLRYLAIMALAPVAVAVTYAPFGWSKLLIGVAGFYILAHDWPLIVKMISRLFKEKDAVVADNSMLLAALEESAYELRSTLAERAQKQSIVDRDDAEKIVNELSQQEKDVIAMLAVLNPNFRTELIDYIEEVVKNHVAKPRLTLVEDDREKDSAIALADDDQEKSPDLSKADDLAPEKSPD